MKTLMESMQAYLIIKNFASAIIIPILVYFLPINLNEKTIPIKIFLSISTFLVIIAVNTTKALYNKPSCMPKMIAFRKSDDCDRIIILIEKNPFFFYDFLLTCYYINSNKEEVDISVGIVTNIQDDKLIQATLIPNRTVAIEELLEKLNEHRNNIRFRPGAKSKYNDYSFKLEVV